MLRTYELTVNGIDPMAVERAVRMMDRIARRWYNVYGGKRTYSGRGAGDEYYVFMEYTLDEMSDGIWVEWNDLKRGFYKKMNKLDPHDELEFHTRPMPWKNQK